MPLAGRSSIRASGASTRRHTEGESIMSQIHYEVPGINQGPHNTCWLACLRMLVMFRVQVGRPVNARAAVLLDPAVIARFEGLNRGLNSTAFEAVAPQFGLSALHIAGLTRATRPGELAMPLLAYDVLERRGPFTLGGTLPTGEAHAMVICGASDGPESDIEFINPQYGHMQHLRYAVYREAFPPDEGALFVF
jgi:hypothetical protein